MKKLNSERWRELEMKLADKMIEFGEENGIEDKVVYTLMFEILADICIESGGEREKFLEFGGKVYDLLKRYKEEDEGGEVREFT